MKKSIIISLIATIFIFFSSCDNEKEIIGDGQIEFSFSNIQEIANKSINTSDSTLTLTEALINIINADGITEEKKLQLVKFNEQYITSPISLLSGDYEISKFIVYAGATTVYATPVEGSSLAHLVDDPLNIPFSITANAVTKITPEVIKTEDYHVDDFGYSTFTFNQVDICNFIAAAFIWNELSNNYTLTDAVLSITTPNEEIIYHDTLDAKSNIISFRDQYDTYIITCTKDDYQSYTETLTADEIKAYERNPLEIILNDSSSITLTLQPDSALGKDAMTHMLSGGSSNDGNYGNYGVLRNDSWTGSPYLKNCRSFIDFVEIKSKLAKGTKIATATLYLYDALEYDPLKMGTNAQTGNNTTLLSRITEDWDEHVITWNNKPATTNVNAVTIPRNNSYTEIEIDVTQLIQDYINEPNSSYGFQIKQETENDPYRSMMFASSDYQIKSHHPKLVITY